MTNLAEFLGYIKYISFNLNQSVLIQMIPSSHSAFHFVHRNSSYWMPFLLSPQFLPEIFRLNYNLWLFAEVLFINFRPFLKRTDLVYRAPSYCYFGHFVCFCFVEGILSEWKIFIRTIIKVKVMHINMNILNTYTIVLVQINLIARIVLMAVEITETVKG